MRVEVGDTIQITVDDVPVSGLPDAEANFSVVDIFEDEGIKVLSVSHEKP